MYRNSFPCTTLRMSNLQLCVYIINVGNVDGGGCGAFSIDSCPTVRPAFSFFHFIFPFAIFPVCFSIFHITFELRFVLLAALCAGYCSTIITITIAIPICNSYQKSRPAIYTTFIDSFIRFYCCLLSTFLESFGPPQTQIQFRVFSLLFRERETLMEISTIIIINLDIHELGKRTLYIIII